jgi:cobyrinic acid a,c-diamide synthase
MGCFVFGKTSPVMHQTPNTKHETPTHGGFAIKGLVIAGTHSGCGKTTISLGLMAALAQRGLKVAPFKVGPDFIDPGHHGRITGAVSRNLDGWMLSKAYNLASFQDAARNADIAVVEGVMGLFDGYDGKTESGSTAQMAKWLGLPVVLIVDAKSMARSAAAVILGFEKFDPNLNFAGVLLNKLGSERHLRYLTEALERVASMPLLGGILRDQEISIPERHLGLFTQEDHPLSREMIKKLVAMIEDSINLDHLLKNLPEADASSDAIAKFVGREKVPVRIGVARDSAFCFYYRDNLDLLEASGAEVVFFSPIADSRLPVDLDGLYFGGGYPELAAERLAANTDLRNQIRDRSQKGMPIYAECGGFMYLCKELFAQNEKRYPMAGCFPFTAQMYSRLKALGYREITLTKDTLIGPSGQTMRGHEFHYSELNEFKIKTDTVYRLTDRVGVDKPPQGYYANRTLGSYTHLHFGSQPQIAVHFVDTCAAYRIERKYGL